MSTGLAVVGLVATLFFGALSIYLMVKRRYPGELTFIPEQCIALFDDLVRNLPDLSVRFRDVFVSDQLVLLRGLLVNTGVKDLSANMVDRPLTAELPEGFRWLAANVTAAKGGPRSQCSVAGEREVQFDLGLFRCNEHVRFEAVAEVPRPEESRGKIDPANLLRYSLVFTHRIADTAPVREADLPQPISRRTKVRRAVLAVYFLGCTLLFSAMALILPYRTGFEISDDQGKAIRVTAIPRGANEVDLDGVDSHYSRKLSLGEFRALAPKVVLVKEIRTPFVVFAAVLFLVFLVISALWIIDLRKARRLRRLSEAYRS